MEFNRLISLVIGFIVLILVFVWVGSRFRSTTITQNGTTVTITQTVTPTKATNESGRNWNPFSFLFNRNSPTPTPSIVESQKVTKTPNPTVVSKTGSTTGSQNQPTKVVVYKNNKTGETTTISNSGVTKIPETGAPTMVIPLAFSALTLGAYLRKRV